MHACRPSVPPEPTRLLAASITGAETERHHDQREMAEAGDDEAHQVAERPAAKAAINNPESGSPQPHLEISPAV